MNSKILDTMIDKAYEVLEHAYAPYSHFTVGCCLRTEDGQLFAGCNIENVTYSLTLHAEAVALGNLISAGHKRIAEIVVVTKRVEVCTPCGACRQQFAEFTSPNTKIILCSNREVKHVVTMAELLPLPFSFEKQE